MTKQEMAILPDWKDICRDCVRLDTSVFIERIDGKDYVCKWIDSLLVRITASLNKSMVYFELQHDHNSWLVPHHAGTDYKRWNQKEPHKKAMFILMLFGRVKSALKKHYRTLTPFTRAAVAYLYASMRRLNDAGKLAPRLGVKARIKMNRDLRYGKVILSIVQEDRIRILRLDGNYGQITISEDDTDHKEVYDSSHFRIMDDTQVNDAVCEEILSLMAAVMKTNTAVTLGE